jgi:hypothetical protein
MKKYNLITILVTIFLMTNLAQANAPLLKHFVDNEEIVDTATHTITKKKIYSFFIVTMGKGFGNYTEQETYNFQGELLNQVFIKEDIMQDDLTRKHVIWTKSIRYQYGKPVYININKRIANSPFVIKDISYRVDTLGHKSKLKDLGAINTIKGYVKPTKIELAIHNHKQEYH